MSGLFIGLLNMSLTASYVALIVIVVRYVLGKLSVAKIVSYVLWLVVLFRLVFPFSIESALSLIPGKAQAIPQDIVYAKQPTIETGIGFVDQPVNRSLQTVLPSAEMTASVNPMQIIVQIGTVIWLAGILVLLTYALLSYVRLKRRLAFATVIEGHIYESDRITTPFVLGMFRPRIYLPIGLPKRDAEYILQHEQTHIRRLDHLIKPLSFCVLALHWFNPLIWLSYHLMIKDMEMSCDEKVLKHTEPNARTSYSEALLALASQRSGLIGPLSFGESNVKSRVRNILNNKRPTFWLGMIIVVVVLALAITMIVNPIDSNKKLAEEKAQIAEMVTLFGSKLALVSLTNPKAVILQEMQTHYSDFVSSQLIEQWAEEPDQAPGRLTSSPWPDRIETINVEWIQDGSFAVNGTIVEVIAEAIDNNITAATRSIQLRVEKIDGHWYITQVTLGDFESEAGQGEVGPPPVDEKLEPDNEMAGEENYEEDVDQVEKVSEYVLYVGDDSYPVRSHQTMDIALEEAKVTRFSAEGTYLGGYHYQTTSMEMSTVLVDDERGQGEIIRRILAIHDATTSRGISIGDSLSDLQAAYSGLTNIKPWTWTSDQSEFGPLAELPVFNRVYVYVPNEPNLIRFYVNDRKVVAIELDDNYGFLAGGGNHTELLGVTGVFMEINNMSPRGANYKFMYINEAGEEVTLLDLNARHYYEVDFDDDGITELMVYESDGSLGIYGLVNGEITYMNVNEQLGATYASGMENMGNVHREYSNHIQANFMEADGSTRSDVYKYVAHELIYVVPFDDALR